MQKNSDLVEINIPKNGGHIVITWNKHISSGDKYRTKLPKTNWNVHHRKYYRKNIDKISHIRENC